MAAFLPPEVPGPPPVWRADGRSLQVNEVFYSIEGEGLRVGEPTTFVRLARCNLRCAFCDTEFDRLTEMDVDRLVEEVKRHPARWVCFTGGEPLGQNLELAAVRLRQEGYRLHLETNGTLSPPAVLFGPIEHWTVSPKRYPIAPGFLRITELKYVVGRSFREDRVQEELAGFVYLQPESSDPRYVRQALEVLARHPTWRLSCRIHKVLGLP
jgi:organic radical activating enzyme